MPFSFRLRWLSIVCSGACILVAAVWTRNRSANPSIQAADSAPGFARIQKLIASKDRSNPTPGLILREAPPGRKDKMVCDENVWRKSLSAERYRVLRLGGTENAFTSPLLAEHRRGIFRCAACKNPLFDAAQKYDSGTGWPSFFGPKSNDAVWYRLDRSVDLRRTEVKCGRCDGHLGHVFTDGPQIHGGRRYCIDGLALEFVPKSP